MSNLAISEKRYDIFWGVINPGNAACHSIHQTKKEALLERQKNAYAYAVVRVKVQPIYPESGILAEKTKIFENFRKLKNKKEKT